MRLVVLYHPNSEHSGVVQDYARDYQRARGRKLELLSLETRQGADLAETYDVVQYPAVLAIDRDGKMLQLWQGAKLPTMNDLDSHFRD